MEKGNTLSFDALKAAVTGPKMNIAYGDQTFADITAWLHRSLAPANCSGTPAPTPTPLSNEAKGEIVYTAMCKQCHASTSELRSNLGSPVSSAITKLRNAIREEPEMRSIAITDEQIRTLYIYLRSIP
jgi:mono/diheme cytochrome c family protein